MHMVSITGCYVAYLIDQGLKHENTGSCSKNTATIAEKTNPLYLGASDKVEKISPVLKGPYGKKQKKLMNKFFGST